MSRYPEVPLGEVLTVSRDEVRVEPDETYEIAGVYSFGKGLFRRASITGSETRYSKFLRLSTDHLVLSRLKAWEGAVAVVTPEFQGCVVSQEFPSFRINPKRCDPQFLGWICRWEDFWTKLSGRSRGMGARRERVHPERLFETKIPLPMLPEQNRIANWLNEVNARIGGLRSKTSLALKTHLALVPSILGEVFANTPWPEVALERHAEVHRGRGSTYLLGSGVFAINQACVRWEGLDLAQTREVDPDWASSLPKWALVRPLDMLVNSTGEGTIGRACVVPNSAPPLPFDSHVLAVRSNPEELLSPYLAMYLRSPQGQAAIEAAKGAKTTKQTELGKEKLERLAVPLPMVSDQRKLVEYFERVRETAARCIDLRRGSLQKAEALQLSSVNHALGG